MNPSASAVALAVSAFCAARGGDADRADRMHSYMIHSFRELPVSAVIAFEQLQQAWEQTDPEIEQFL